MILTDLIYKYFPRKSYNVKFRLERLQCEPYIQDAIVDCCLEYDDHHGETTEIEFFTPITDDHSDEIRLEISVNFPGITETFTDCSNEGIRRLSEDLINLYKDYRIVRDLQLCFQAYRHGVHIAILLHRLTNEHFQ